MSEFNEELLFAEEDRQTVEFIQVEGEDHFVADYDKRVLWHNTIMAWFARYLQGTDKWWNDLYPERHL